MQMSKLHSIAQFAGAIFYLSFLYSPLPSFVVANFYSTLSVLDRHCRRRRICI